MFQCLDLFPLASLLLAAVSTAGQILPPQNLSLSWINEFRIELTWEPAPHSMTHCHYKVVGKTDYSTIKVQSYADDVCMEGGFLSYALSIVCGNNHSEPAVLEISYPELVKTLDCYIYSSKKGHCSWSPAWNTTDLRFFYWLDSQFSYEPRTELQECSLYSYTGDVKTGCDFPANSLTIIQMLFNATLNNTVVWNTFCRDNLKVKPPAPTWTVIKTKNEFNISWNTSDMPEIQPWEFRINYTACNKEETVVLPYSTSHVLKRVSHCQYCIRFDVKSDRGNSLPSDEKCFDADEDIHWLVVAVLVFLIATVAAITFVCCHRNKDIIWPKVPGPPDFLSDLIENNNENFFHKLYIPAEEEENCTVTLATDTQTKKPDC